MAGANSRRSVEMQRVSAFPLELKEVGIAGQCDGCIPDSAGILTTRNPRDDWPEDRAAVDLNGRGPDVFTDLVHPDVMAIADRAVVVSRVSRLCELGRQ